MNIEDGCITGSVCVCVCTHTAGTPLDSSAGEPECCQCRSLSNQGKDSAILKLTEEIKGHFGDMYKNRCSI